MVEQMTMVVDADAVDMVLGADELATAANRRSLIRATIDEIAERVETELERRGLDGYEVEREYGATGRRSAEGMHEVWDAVLIGQVDAIRSAVIGG